MLILQSFHSAIALLNFAMSPCPSVSPQSILIPATEVPCSTLHDSPLLLWTYSLVGFEVKIFVHIVFLLKPFLLVFLKQAQTF